MTSDPAATERLARRVIGLIDLTDLTDDCTPERVVELCSRAIAHGTAAVCVWPDFVATARTALAGTAVKIATVVNFPDGDERPFAVGVLTERALADGADEIDVVLPYRAWLGGDTARAAAVLDRVREVASPPSRVKVILETGALPDRDAVSRAAELAVAHGADFVKTSTGKIPVSATLEAAEAILAVLRRADRDVGIKPSGGIGTLDTAAAYLELADGVMGSGWATAETFRFGASGLLGAVLAELGDHEGASDRSGY